MRTQKCKAFKQICKQMWWQPRGDNHLLTYPSTFIVFLHFSFLFEWKILQLLHCHRKTATKNLWHFTTPKLFRQLLTVLLCFWHLQKCFQLSWFIPRSKTAGWQVILWLAFEKLSTLFPNALHHSTLIPAKYKGVNFSTSSPALVLVFLITVILADVMCIPLWFWSVFP